MLFRSDERKDNAPKKWVLLVIQDADDVPQCSVVVNVLQRLQEQLRAAGKEYWKMELKYVVYHERCLCDAATHAEITNDTAGRVTLLCHGNSDGALFYKLQRQTAAWRRPGSAEPPADGVAARMRERGINPAALLEAFPRATVYLASC